MTQCNEGERRCHGCNALVGERHFTDCPYWHPWPRDRVDNVQSQIEPVTLSDALPGGERDA